MYGPSTYKAKRPPLRHEGRFQIEDVTLVADTLPDSTPSVLHKHPKTRGYVQIENDVARSPNLSLKAAGLLLHILSLPNGAPIGSRVIAASRPDGRTAILSAFRELREAGHVVQEKVQRPNGQWVTISHVFECPEDRGAVSRPRHRGAVSASDRGAVSAPPLSEKEQLLKNAGHRFQCSGCERHFDDFDAYCSHLEMGCTATAVM